MTGMQLFESLGKEGTGISVDAVIRLNESDHLAADIAKVLYNHFPDVKNGDMIRALDNLRWWIIFISSTEDKPNIACGHCHRENPPYAKAIKELVDVYGEFLCKDCVTTIFGRGNI